MIYASILPPVRLSIPKLTVTNFVSYECPAEFRWIFSPEFRHNSVEMMEFRTMELRQNL